MYTALINGIKVKRDDIEPHRIIALIVPHKDNEITCLLENTSKYKCIDFINRNTHDIYIFEVSPAITENDLRRDLVFELNTTPKTEQGRLCHRTR